MLRIIGAVLTAVGAAWIGFSTAAALRRRGQALAEIADGLECLALELERDAPALPRLMERTAAVSRGGARLLFRECAQALDGTSREPFALAWRRLVEAQPELGTEGQQALLPLANALGRCDGLEQQRELRSAAGRLRELGRRAEEDYRQQGRVYRTLGLSGGAFLVILLL